MSDPFYANTDELAVLGACLLGSLETSADAVGALSPVDFINDDVRESLDVIRGMVNDGVSSDLTTLPKAWAKVHGTREAPLAVWAAAMDACPSPSNLPLHLEGVKEASRRRQARTAAQLLQNAVGDPSKPVDAALADFETRILENSPSASSIGDSKTVVREFIADAEARFARKGQLSGITSGLSKFDRMTDGIQRGEMTIVAARPSIGKTAIGMCIVDAACIRGDVPTLVVTAEMYRSALMRRLIAVHARVPMQSLRTGDLSERDFKAMTDGGGRIGKAPLHFFDAVVDPSVDRVVAEIRRAVRKYGIQLVLVDYLQKLQASASHEKRTYEVAEVSGKLRACAVSTGVAMVVLAQLNRESEKEKGRAPRLSDLADSGQIERDADTVALLSRDRNVKHGDAMLLVAKQRDGETGGVPLLFEGEFCRFSDAPADTGE